MNNQDAYIRDLKRLVEKEAKIVRELISLFREQEKSQGKEENDMISLNIKTLKNLISRTNDDLSSVMEDMTIVKPLPDSKMRTPNFNIKPKTNQQYKQCQKCRDKIKLEN